MASADRTNLMRSKIRCLLVISNNDLERKTTNIIANDPDCIICGRVRDVKQAAILIKILRPELILSDSKLEQLKTDAYEFVLLRLSGSGSGITVQCSERSMKQKQLAQWLDEYKMTTQENCVQINNSNEGDRLAVKSNGSMIIFSVNELRALQAAGKQTQALFANRTITINIRFGIFLKYVKADFLIRVDRGTAINAQHVLCVKKMNPGAVLSMNDGSEITVGRKAYYRLLNVIQ